LIPLLITHVKEEMKYIFKVIIWFVDFLVCDKKMIEMSKSLCSYKNCSNHIVAKNISINFTNSIVDYCDNILTIEHTQFHLNPTFLAM
jgi:hypothetical protein